MSDRLAIELQEFSELDRELLLEKWRSGLKEPAPVHLRRQILLPLFLYKLQEKAYGGLKTETKRRLRKLAKSFDTDSRDTTPVGLAGPLQIKPGTRLIRQWQGKTHHVVVSEQGFEYSGQHYKSLSHIARSITGTRWSGPLFFGLKKNTRKSGKA